MPAPGAATSTCRRHRRRASLAVCTICAAAMCGECIVQTRVGFKCPACSGETPARGRAGGRTPRVLAAAAVVVVSGGLLVARVVGGGAGEATDGDGGSPAVASVAAVERAVQFEGAGGLALGATLGLPPRGATDGEVPGVLILPGFGPTDRNALYPPGRPADPLYRDVSEALLDEGMVTFRYDKRGTGESALPAGEPLRLDDMVADAASAVDFLAGRTEVDQGRIAVVGHEEGGLVALQLAASDQRVAALVLVSVPGRPLVEVVADDFRNSGHGDDVGQLHSVVGGLLAGGPLPEPAALPPSLRDFFPPEQQDYLRDIFAVDPVTVASEVDVPALVIRGEGATGISAVDGDALATTLGDDAEQVAVPNAGHTLLRMEQGGAAGERTEGNSSDGHGGPSRPGVGSRDDGALDRIRRFLSSVLA